MKYAIVVSSKGGNTRMLGDAIQTHLGNEHCVYMGGIPQEEVEADVIFVGFWTDKGSCTEDMKNYLSSLQHKHIFLFGTCGFGKDASYFERILGNVAANIKDDNTLLGGFMCQGKMAMTVRERYVSMLDEKPEMKNMIDNFDQALLHPNEEDCQNLCTLIDKKIKAHR